MTISNLNFNLQLAAHSLTVCVNLTDQILLKACVLYTITARDFACFQFHPTLNRTADKGDGVQNWQRMNEHAK
jgi:hypothetical protein